MGYSDGYMRCRNFLIYSILIPSYIESMPKKKSMCVCVCVCVCASVDVYVDMDVYVDVFVMVWM